MSRTSVWSLLLLPVVSQIASAQTATQSFLEGVIAAPRGTTVVLQKDGASPLSLAIAQAGPELFASKPFRFPTSYRDGSPYTLAVRSASPGKTCVVEKGARGTIGSSPGFVRVGCDYTYDLLSRSSENTRFGTFYESLAPVVGGDVAEEGRYVAFVSAAAGLGNASGKKRQVFWRDRNTGVTQMISVGPSNAEGNGDSLAPSMSADGQSVAFESYATNLVPTDGNGVRDVFVWNARTNVVTAVSTGDGESEANAESFEPVISGDGSVVAFSSSANNLAAGMRGSSSINVYLKRVASGQAPILLSVDPKTRKSVGGSNPSISDDGTRVTFCSSAMTLVANDRNGLWDIFLYDASSPGLKRLSVPGPGAERNQGTESATRAVASSISGNGAFVVFATTATNMVADDTNKAQDVFVVSIETGEVKRVSTGADGVQGDGDSPVGQGEKIAVSFEGTFIAFSTGARNLGGQLVMRNLVTGDLQIIASEQRFGVGRPAVSRNGGYVVFGAGSRLDRRYPSTGLFARFTGTTRCRFCTQ